MHTVVPTDPTSSNVAKLNRLASSGRIKRWETAAPPAGGVYAIADLGDNGMLYRFGPTEARAIDRLADALARELLLGEGADRRYA